MTKGILTGCNERHEWMLKWWWKNYSTHNSYPVTFCDFGMSPSARMWCQTKGEVISQTAEMLPIKNLNEQVQDPPWKKHIASYLWSHRPIWFLKPFAYKQTPYQRTLWLDIDCEIKGQLAPLIDLPLSSHGMGLTEYCQESTQKMRAKGIINPKAQCISSSVVVYEKDSVALSAWIEYILQYHPQELSEDTCFANLLAETPLDITQFPIHFNYNRHETPNPNALIYHHSGFQQKRKLLQTITFN
ncbi:MAG: hypothetical protein KDK64_02230 [Chlamydiia bacterium]|nr:hypothetical protein [Chlamydiia bacterium]